MTKEQLMNGMGALLDLLDVVPDGTEILSATLPAPYICSDRRSVELHIHNNIGRIAEKLGLQVTQDCNCYPDMVRLAVRFEHGEILQLEQKEAPPLALATPEAANEQSPS